VSHISDNKYSIENPFWKLTINKNNEQEFEYILHDKVNHIDFSDGDYHYRVLTSSKRGARYIYLNHIGSEINAKKLTSREIRVEDPDKIVIEGKFEDTELLLTHIFKLTAESKWLEEFITITNEGKKRVRLGFMNLGFEKTLFKQYSGWIENLDQFFLTSIPYRRFLGYGDDKRKKNYTANDLLLNAWVDIETELPGYCAEGWLWSTKNNGLIICKYNQTEMEYSRFQSFSKTLPGRGAEDTYIIFGGVYLYEGNPEAATLLEPKQSYSFGISKYAIYEGNYKEGYYLYRSHLDGQGHKFKEEYDPPIHWNELYNLGWVAEKTGFFVDSTDFELYTLEQLYEEAKLAKDIGAESLYLDPGWNISLGSAIWNDERFGSLKNFSETIHNKFNLKLALHLMMNFEGEDEPDEFYLTTKKGVRVVADPYINLFCVCANDYWVKEKTRRLLELAKEEIDFFMFDFTELSMFMVDNLGCFNKNHGHEVPMKRQTHAENILKVIQNIKKEYPNILIEAHDRGVKPRHPLYYQHNLLYSFDENWGFECMWNPMQDLISGRALQLFEYNLAYSIPLYLHINEHSDNDQMLQFWWYASLVRHLGIGGLNDEESVKYKALKEALTLYKKNKAFFTRGTFYGIHKYIHLHIDEHSKHGILTAYNITSNPKQIEIQLDLKKYGLDINNVDIYDGLNRKIANLDFVKINEDIVRFHLDIPSLSPRICILRN
jgi:hypothetical protein